MRDNQNILYHYTDFSALDGILSSSELRLNNVLNMNDASEMLFFMNGLCRAVSEKFQEKRDPERAEWTQKIFSEEKKKEFVYSAYAACFSCYRDDAAQWERYANRGRGVCIAFREELLLKMAVVRLVVSPFEQGFFDVKPRYHITKERIKKYYTVDLRKMCELAGRVTQSACPLRERL